MLQQRQLELRKFGQKTKQQEEIITNMESIKDGFKAMFGIDFDSFSLIELPSTDNIIKYNNPDKYMLPCSAWLTVQAT